METVYLLVLLVSLAALSISMLIIDTDPYNADKAIAIILTLGVLGSFEIADIIVAVIKFWEG